MLWWEEFTPEERAELEAWLAEVNRVNQELPEPEPEQPELPFSDNFEVYNGLIF